MKKRELREKVIVALKSQDSKQKLETDQALLADLVQSQHYQNSQVIATYLAFDFEYNTSLLIDQAKKDGKIILVPKTYPKGKMIFGCYDEKELSPTRFGLLEPTSDEAFEKSQIDLIHVPGVAFNEQGYRVGYGAGYYDRYLADFKGHTVSTIYHFQRQCFEADAHDVAVKEVFYR